MFAILMLFLSYFLGLTKAQNVDCVSPFIIGVPYMGTTYYSAFYTGNFHSSGMVANISAADSFVLSPDGTSAVAVDGAIIQIFKSNGEFAAEAGSAANSASNYQISFLCQSGIITPTIYDLAVGGERSSPLAHGGLGGEVPTVYICSAQYGQVLLATTPTLPIDQIVQQYGYQSCSAVTLSAIAPPTSQTSDSSVRAAMTQISSTIASLGTGLAIPTGTTSIASSISSDIATACPSVGMPFVLATTIDGVPYYYAADLSGNNPTFLSDRSSATSYTLLSNGSAIQTSGDQLDLIVEFDTSIVENVPTTNLYNRLYFGLLFLATFACSGGELQATLYDRANSMSAPARAFACPTGNGGGYQFYLVGSSPASTGQPPNAPDCIAIVLTAGILTSGPTLPTASLPPVSGVASQGGGSSGPVTTSIGSPTYSASGTVIQGPDTVTILVQATLGSNIINLKGQDVAASMTILTIPANQQVTTTELVPLPASTAPASPTTQCLCAAPGVIATVIYNATALSYINLGSTTYVKINSIQTLGPATITNGQIIPATSTITYTAVRATDTVTALLPGQSYETIMVSENGSSSIIEIVIIVSIQVSAEYNNDKVTVTSTTTPMTHLSTFTALYPNSTMSTLVSSAQITS